MMLMTPDKTAQPRPGNARSLMAAAVVATPRNMNPTAIQMANNTTAYPSPKWRNANTARITDAAPLMKSKILAPADAGSPNAPNTCAMPDTSRYTPNNPAATRIEGPGHTRITTPRITANRPDTITDVHKRCTICAAECNEASPVLCTPCYV